MFKVFRILTVIAIGLFLAACHNSEYYRKERVEKARSNYSKISARTIPEGKIFSLNECINTALEHNLNLKVYDLKEQIASEKVTAQLLGMLPELNVTNQLNSRNRTPGSSSYSIETGAQSLTSSRSINNTINNIKIELAISSLDLGLAFLNSAQAEDRHLITFEQRKRAGQNLVFDVVKTYFKVAAAQGAIATTEKLLLKCRNLEKIFIELNRSKSISPFRLLDERRRFIRLEKSLMVYRRSYQDSCIELRSLMGYAPNSKIKVDTSWLKKLSMASLPSITLMEKIALTERPELYQLDFEANVLLNEARKTILTMFPNVRIFIDFTNSNNSFLYTQSWSQFGVNAAYNLLRLPERIAQYNAQSKEIDAVSMRTLALSIGIIAQVRIAHANIQEVKLRYELDARTYSAYEKHFIAAGQSYQSGSSLSKLELDRLELETAETYIARLVSMSNYYVAYYRLLNTLGVKDLDPERINKLADEIEKVEREGKKNKVANKTFKAPSTNVLLPMEKASEKKEKVVDKELKAIIPELVKR